MSKVLVAIKEEIQRVARKEIRMALNKLVRDRKGLKKTVAELKQQLALCQKSIKAFGTCAAKPDARIELDSEETRKARVTGKGVRAQRRKLKLTQAAFGKLVGVTGLAVANWEKKNGPLKMRNKVRQSYLAIRGISVKQAKEQLGL